MGGSVSNPSTTSARKSRVLPPCGGYDADEGPPSCRRIGAVVMECVQIAAEDGLLTAVSILDVNA